MSEMQIVVFSLNGEFCGAYTAQVHEIVKYQQLEKISGIPKFLDGIVTLRGNAIPVISLNRRFDLGEKDTDKKTKIIITETGGRKLGYIVNDVSEILKISDEDMEEAPEMVVRSGNRHILGIGKKGNKLISILNLSKILDESEIKLLPK